MDAPQAHALSFEDPSIEGYVSFLLELRAHRLDVVTAIDRFRERYPNSALTFPDLGSAYVNEDPRRTLSRSLGLRQRECMDKAVENQRRVAIADAKRPMRKEVLTESREATRRVEDELLTALDLAIDAEGRWRAPDIYTTTVAHLARRLNPCAQGFMDLSDTLGHAADLDERFLRGAAEKDDLFVRDGGGYALLSSTDGSGGLLLRREHWSRLIASDAILLARNLRYRGAGRHNETKGLSGEEGRRRGIAQVITGRRDGINTRSMRDMAEKIMPWLHQRYAQRARLLALHRDIPKAHIQTFAQHVADGFPLDHLAERVGLTYTKLKSARVVSKEKSAESSPAWTQPNHFPPLPMRAVATAVQQTWFA